MHFKEGQKVSFIDEDIKGIIQAVDGEAIIVETNDGFVMNASAKELIILRNLEELDLQEERIAEALADKKDAVKRPKPSEKLRKAQAPMEVDLHAHNLTAHEKRMTNFEILNLQLDTARTRLEFAIEKRIQKIVFIHGVGEGVLRMELETLFSRYNNVSYYDADFKRYGAGATEVFIFQNPK